MITDADIKKMKRVFVTKEDFKKFITKDELKISLEKYATKDDLINFKDAILNEIIKLREDVTVVIGYRDLIEDHDKRIEKLETTVYQ